MTNRKCSRCGEVKPLERFGVIRRKGKPERRCLHCLDCRQKMRSVKLSRDINYYLRDKFNKIKARAKKDKTPFNITLDYFVNLYNGECFYFGTPLERGDISVDRLLPNEGYIVGNIVFCSVKANTIKSNLTLSELEIWIPRFYQKIKGVIKDG